MCLSLSLSRFCRFDFFAGARENYVHFIVYIVFALHECLYQDLTCNALRMATIMMRTFSPQFNCYTPKRIGRSGFSTDFVIWLIYWLFSNSSFFFFFYFVYSIPFSYAISRVFSGWLTVPSLLYLKMAYILMRFQVCLLLFRLIVPRKMHHFWNGCTINFIRHTCGSIHELCNSSPCTNFIAFNRILNVMWMFRLQPINNTLLSSFASPLLWPACSSLTWTDKISFHSKFEQKKGVQCMKNNEKNPLIVWLISMFLG